MHLWNTKCPEDSHTHAPANSQTCGGRPREPSQLYARRLARALALAAAIAAASGAEPAWRAGLLPSLSPFNALLAAAAGAGALFMLGALASALVCMFFPRAFCRWLCPAGTCQDALSFFVKRRKWIGRVPQIGVWLVCVGLGAALAGYPLFGWLDPLVLFNTAFSRVGADSGVWTRLAVAGLPALMVLALLAPGLWCGRLCPLGALQDLLRLPARAWAASKQSGGNVGALIGRRAFIGLGLGAGYRLALNPARADKKSVLVRPPSRVDSSRFTRLCVRCGACARACPARARSSAGVDAAVGPAAAAGPACAGALGAAGEAGPCAHAVRLVASSRAMAAWAVRWVAVTSTILAPDAAAVRIRGRRRSGRAQRARPTSHATSSPDSITYRTWRFAPERSEKVSHVWVSGPFGPVIVRDWRDSSR